MRILTTLRLRAMARHGAMLKTSLDAIAVRQRRLIQRGHRLTGPYSTTILWNGWPISRQVQAALLSVLRVGHPSLSLAATYPMIPARATISYLEVVRRC